MLLPFLLSVTPTQQGGWTPLEAPPLCAPLPAPIHPGPLLDGLHVLLRPRGGDAERQAPPPRLPLALVTQMLEEEARARGSTLEFFRASPALLARGDEAALTNARNLLADLRSQGELLEIDLVCELVPQKAGGTGGTGGGAGSGNPGGSGTTTLPVQGKTRIRSGGEAFFGARRTTTFVASFDVEVAADSGVAQPILGSVLTGPSVHVRAARVDGGRRVHLQGVLDLAELGDVQRFDPDTPDLGVVEQPSVRAVQIVFAGVVENGGKLEVQVAGSALSTPDWKLVLTPTTRADLEAAAGGTTGWAVLDLAFLASEPQALSPSTPGGRLAREAGFAGHAHPAASLPPSALAAALEEGRSGTSSSSTRSARAPLYWTNDLLFVPRSEPRLMQDARALLRAAEGTRLSTGRVELRQGGLTISLPVCEGHVARVQSVLERSFLTDYRSELAPQTWMPAPDPELVSDGVCIELSAQSGALSCSAWSAASGPVAEVARKDAQLGKLQVLRRTLWTDAARVSRKETGRSLFAAEPSGPGLLSIAFDSP